MKKSTYDRIMLQRQTDRLWTEADRYEDSDPRLRFSLILNLVRKGHNDPGLFQNLAYAYAAGEGTTQNRLQALRWDRKAWRRGLASAACNAGIDSRWNGRDSVAEVWFRRAIATGDTDALFHLAKLLITKPQRSREIISLLQRRVAHGPETIYQLSGLDKTFRSIEDCDFIEAQRLLKDLTVDQAPPGD